MIRLLFLALLIFIAWQLLRRWLAQQRSGPQAPPSGFSAEPESLVRCERCGIRIPASQVAAVRANCRQCGNDHPGG